MSTNFYWNNDNSLSEDHPFNHIGKRYSAGAGKTGFVWCQPRHDVVRTLIAVPGWLIVIKDEYGRYYTSSEFMDVIDDVTEQKNSIGNEFC